MGAAVRSDAAAAGVAPEASPAAIRPEVFPAVTPLEALLVAVSQVATPLEAFPVAVSPVAMVVGVAEAVDKIATVKLRRGSSDPLLLFLRGCDEIISTFSYQRRSPSQR